MAYQVKLPKLGESIHHATIGQLLKKEGDRVEIDEPLMEVATDKVNSEIPSPVAGVIVKIPVQIDQEIAVGDVIMEIETNQISKIENQSKEKKPHEPKVSTASSSTTYFSPAVLRLAQEHQIDIEQLKKIPPTGRGGRISKKDVERFLNSQHTQQKSEATRKQPTFDEEEIEIIPISKMRKKIAQNMVRAFSEVPHASLLQEVDVTALVQKIQENKASFLKKHGVKLSITTFIAKAIALAAKEYPLVNACMKEDAIEVKKFVNLGIAVSLDQGLIVPVVRNCHSNSLVAIAKAIASLSQKARCASLSPQDVQGSTITMSNFGMSGTLIGIPIIPHPEVAIIGVGAIHKRVMPLDDQSIGIRHLMYLSLTFDHRVFDGMYGCSFLSSLKSHLENPSSDFDLE